MSHTEASPPVLSQQPAPQEAAAYLPETHERAPGWVNGALGWVAVAGAGAVYSVASRWGWSGRVGIGNLPYTQQAADALNNLDTALAYAGAVGMGTALAAVGVTKIATHRSPRWQAVDEYSSVELTTEGAHIPRGLRRRVPFSTVPALAAAMTSMFVGIGYEIEHGPSRPIRAAAAYFPGGENTQLVVENKGAMPMVQSDITPALTKRVVAEAGRRHVLAVPFTQHLITFDKDGQERTALAIGLPVTSGPLNWQPKSGCNNIPVAVDKISGAHVGDRVDVHGISGGVTELTQDQTATNRLGAVVDADVAKACIQKNSNNYGVALDTTQGEAAEILAAANSVQPEAAATITFDQYVENSRSFWEKNVKPLTNLITAIATGLAFVSISRETSMRLLRTHKELASILLSSSSAFTVQAMETVRTLKKNINAAIVGATAPIAGISVVSSVVFGAQPGVGIKEALAGAGTVFVASFAALARSVFRTKSFVKGLSSAEGLR